MFEKIDFLRKPKINGAEAVGKDYVCNIYAHLYINRKLPIYENYITKSKCCPICVKYKNRQASW